MLEDENARRRLAILLGEEHGLAKVRGFLEAAKWGSIIELAVLVGWHAYDSSAHTENVKLLATTLLAGAGAGITGISIAGQAYVDDHLKSLSQERAVIVPKAQPETASTS